MKGLITLSVACLLGFVPRLAAQEIDADTLQDVESQQRFDELMLDALPGSSAAVRVDAGSALSAARLLLEHPNYRLGYVLTASSVERWWTILGDTTWMLAAGDVVVHRGLGMLTSVARSMGRSRLTPRAGLAKRSAAEVMPSPIRAGAGGLRGLGASLQIDSLRRLHVAFGTPCERPGETVAMIGADVRRWGITASATLIAGNGASGTALSGSASASGMVGNVGVGAELAIDAHGRAAMQCLVAIARGASAASLTLWNAHASADLPLGSLPTSSRSVTNSWGGDLRLRITQRGVATARLSVMLSGTHGRSWLLPVASRMVDVIGDVEQHVTDRLHIEWRLRHRRDENGYSDDVRRQYQRHSWMVRLRLRRTVHDRLEVRCTADLRLLQQQATAGHGGSLGWIEARWQTGLATVLRVRASVFASDNAAVAPMMVEYAARGLQTLVSTSGYGRRIGLGVEWNLTPLVCMALQASVETRIRPGEHRSMGDLRATFTVRARREDVLRGVALQEDDMPQPRE